MTRLGQENLVSFSTIAETEGKKTTWLRPRTVAYATLLTGIAIAFFALGAARHDIEATVNRSPGSLYLVDADGWTRNTFMVKVTNNHAGEGELLFDLSVAGIAGAEIIAPPIRVASDQSITVPMVVRAPPGAASRTVPLRIELSTEFDRVVVDATFKSGADNRG
jgi:polyferredoxin